MHSIQYRRLDTNSQDELKRAAEIHESAPLNWDANYVVTEERVQAAVETFLKIKDRDTVFLFVAQCPQGDIVGFHWIDAVKNEGPTYARINSLWVDSRHRKKGIAQHLKLEGENWARSHAAKYIKTGVFYNNQTMIDFNLKQGFKIQQLEMVKPL